MNCEQIRAELALYLYGELSFDAEEMVERHVEQCATCQRELEKERVLHAAVDRLQLEPPPALLAQSRRALFNQIGNQSRARRPQVSWLDRLGELFTLNAAWWKPAGAVALLVVGFAGGRWQTLTNSSATSGLRPAPEVLATRVKNVEPDPSGRVRIVLEETRQRTVMGAPQDERIRDLLLAAAQDPGDPGLRVESVELLQKSPVDQEVRKALLQALERDANPGVRLKALEGLRSFSGSPDVQRTLAQVLLRDDNVGVRTQAVELLTQQRPREVVGVLQEAMQKEENDYIRLRTQRVLRDLGASVDTF
ncbi:MAG: HEAT repeat domain-containing protein [Bryobacterales bacterium]|nr:HEAT repeat domain-containing protein [Bryobacterales bacterium]